MQRRLLKPAEAALARSVCANSLPYDDIFVTDLAIGSTAVTLSGIGVPRGRFVYQICWPAGYVSIMGDFALEATLIHELAHVWQGHHGVWPTVYMGQSMLDQLSAGIRDIIEKREWRGWDEHRSGAYTLEASRFGKPWRSFNVEQQASIVETWFLTEKNRRRFGDFGPDVRGGAMSPYDKRFPYIRDVIRKRDRNAPYRPVDLLKGTDPAIKAIQDRLVELGYLDATHADGLVGRSHSATLNAIVAFQQRNGLKPDRDLGGAKSETRRRLALPVGQLRAAP